VIIKSVFHYVFKKVRPISYARWLGVKVGADCRLIKVDFSSEPYLITIGNHVSATAVRFETHDGGVWVARNSHPKLDLVKPITVGNNVFIGYGAVIMPGINIADNSVIGAYSVVTKNIPENSVAVGVPAKVIKTTTEYVEKSIIQGDNTKLMGAIDKQAYYMRKFKKELF
jgi:acetyltransferase-like isoleucine patch superfamily enzyme